MSLSPAHKKILVTAAPIIFVLLWSTGFIGAKMGMPHAEPFTFLAIRFVLASALFILILIVMRVPWPRAPIIWLHASVVGILMQGIYLCGVFYAVYHGTSAGISALIVGVQPVLTAIFAGLLLSERLSGKAWFGLVLGFVGIVLVLWRQAGDTGGMAGIIACVASLIAITAATLYQKHYATGIDLRVGSAIQFAAAAALMWVMALAAGETMIIDWNGESIFAMVWLVLVLSIGAITLLYILIRQGAASKVASLFYLVPPVVAVEGYLLFDEILSPMALLGMGITVIGVALVTRG
jgi:drug/metabolite transporter (DMT)-like permease